MRPKRGCGCLVLVLVAVDLLITISSIVGAFRDSDPVKTSTAMGLIMAVIMASNVAVCMLFALSAFRRGRDSGSAPTGDESELGEGEDEEEGNDQP
jgi:hypothetical protein